MFPSWKPPTSRLPECVLDPPKRHADPPHVFTPNPDRPYFEAWLRRTGRQFAISGRLSQTAVILAAENGGTPEEWRSRLRTLMEGHEIPSLDLLMRIDTLLSGTSAARADDDGQDLLF